MSAIRQFIASNVYAKLFRSPHWRVGWRPIAGNDLWDTQSLENTRWNALPDPRIRFLADPIAIHHEGRTILYVEDFHHHRQKGIISAIEFAESGPVGPARPVLEEPWHLSYPLVFEDGGQVWMIPESFENREVTLYRADPFPYRWTKEVTLVPDVPAVDATLVRKDGLYWLLMSMEGGGYAPGELHIYHAPALLGPWTPHRGNPVLRDPATARSAGPIVARGGALWRPVQDCSHHYGAAVGLAQITRLDPKGYEQVVRNWLRPGQDWPGRRLHTVSQAGGFEFIDGSANVLRFLPPLRTI